MADGLDVVAVGVEHEGCVIVVVVVRSQAGFAIGNLYLKYQPLGYLLNVLGTSQ